MKRWLAAQGATFQPAKGSHVKVFLNGKQSILPMHGAEMKTGTVEAHQETVGAEIDEGGDLCWHIP
jgi:mRNA interferase HicA